MMNGAVVLIPLAIIRILIPQFLGLNYNQRITAFAPMTDKQKQIYYVYQIVQVFLIAVPFYYNIQWASIWNYLGAILLVAGSILLLIAILDFRQEGLVTSGVYRWSRHPMYVAYYIYYLGAALLMNAWIYAILLVIFIISGHTIVLAEEAWCHETYPEAYKDYCQTTRRYI
ncbi:methyltransferase family protein [Fundicoccus culcitae]|uniref:Isoprenylcysteine carboxylmethyltransferase family protein n=1 Tax=Fundicoccus culcitae TaxID=2969821 RepID=A0ABY5P5H2_9LACT|nr:isoprenylcysteine carboxylmethyltransferase family protein [Fundicoccus culcitae]UUX33678.1 isoprenylcysteine carboxylmethyltransferase family protein [Fundicoccus culcitae]